MLQEPRDARFEIIIDPSRGSDRIAEAGMFDAVDPRHLILRADPEANQLVQDEGDQFGCDEVQGKDDDRDHCLAR